MLDILTPTVAAWIGALLVPATVLVVSMSALVERSSPIRLRHWAEGAGARLSALYRNPRRFEAFRFLLSWSAKLLPALTLVVATVVFGGWLEPQAAIAAAAAAIVVVLGAVEWIDRVLVEHHAESALDRLTPLLLVASLVLAPWVWLLGHVAPDGDDDLDDEEDEDEVSDNEIRAFIDVGRREGILEPEEEALVRGIVDFGDSQVKSVMTPRVEVVAAPIDGSLETLAARFFESKHARLPLYNESVDHVVGILHIRDLFEAMHQGGEATAADLVKPPLFVPETKALRDLLRELQSLRQQMAIVVDEYGGVAGLVTVEDLVEEIVGDIADEHETDDDGIEVLADGRWRVPGRTELWELAEETGLSLDELPYETVSGLICGELGYVPTSGETFRWNTLAFEIEGADGRRVTSALVERHDVPAEPASPTVEGGVGA